MLSILQSPSISPSSSPTTSITQEALPVTLSNPSSSTSSSSTENKQKPRRNYIQRKKCLNNSVNQIVNVLNIIQILQKDTGSPIEKQKVAYEHAQKIEAACWSPHSKLTPESYEKLISAKTQELCRVIFKKSIPQLDSNKIQRLKQICSKNPTTLTLNTAQLDSININSNSNSKSSKAKSGLNQMNNLAFEQPILPEFTSQKNVIKTGTFTIDALSNVSLAILDSSSTNLMSGESFPNIMLNNTSSTPIFPENSSNRISIAPLKEMAPNLSTFVIPIEKTEQTQALNSLSEFEPIDSKFPIDESNPDFSIDPLLINQNGQTNDMFQQWNQKDPDLFGSCAL